MFPGPWQRASVNKVALEDYHRREAAAAERERLQQQSFTRLPAARSPRRRRVSFVDGGTPGVGPDSGGEGCGDDAEFDDTDEFGINRPTRAAYGRHAAVAGRTPASHLRHTELRRRERDMVAAAALAWRMNPDEDEDDVDEPDTRHAGGAPSGFLSSKSREPVADSMPAVHPASKAAAGGSTLAAEAARRDRARRASGLASRSAPDVSRLK